MQIYISMLPDISVLQQEDIVIIEALPRMLRPRLTFKQVTPTLLEILKELTTKKIPVNAVLANIMKIDGIAGVAKWNHYVKKLCQHSMLQYHLSSDEYLLATFEPLTTYCHYDMNKVKKDTYWTVSKFAYCHKDHDRMILNSPLGFARIILHHLDALTAFFHLQKPHTAESLPQLLPAMDALTAQMYMNFLANAGVLLPTDQDNDEPEASDPVLAQWAFHDLLFHANNRMGRHGDPYGGTYPFKDKFEALPMIKPAMSDVIIPLFKPDMDKLQEEDTSFTKILETRQSIRKYGEPLTVEQLGEFLYRTARIKKMAPGNTVSARPSPGGGAIHSIEIYPVINRCQGLEKGIYHYNPEKHHLEHLTEAPENLIQTLINLSQVTGKLEEETPQVLFILAARFQRVQIKYQSVAYSVILKDVGCLYQTMYLVATSMGLAPCALGGGDSDLFTNTTGLNYYEETSVGEFLLGSAPKERPQWGV
ncbi:MAG TPA: SagB family peptide dehydrogenase [Planctomycetota bacterium]|nr:SagB family peptide dehydrogenase [Planctomycetota bacterium]